MEENEVVLYDWIQIADEWDTDINTGELTGHGDELESANIFGAISSRLGSLLRYAGLGSGQSGCKLPTQLVALLSCQGPWSVSLSPCGMYLAVLRRNYLELRSHHDNFATIKECTQIAIDRKPQWRKLFWSGTESSPAFVALALSSGKVFLFDSTLNVTKRLDPLGFGSENGIELSVAAVHFPRVRRATSRHVCVIHRNGAYTLYRFDQKNVATVVRRDVLETPNGIEDLVWAESHEMLITVGGQCQGQLARNRVGLCGWSYETKNGEFIGLTERHKIINAGESVYQRVKSGLLLAYDPLAVTGSRLITLTPDQTRLAIVELDGTISVWRANDLTPLHQFQIDDQPGSSEVPRDAKDARTLQAHYADLSSSLATRLSWWNGSLVVTRLSGAISVYAITNQGVIEQVTETDWASPAPCTSGAVDDCMFGLEQSLKSSGTKDFFDIEENEKTLVARSSDMLRGALYYLTEMERFNQAEQAATSTVKRDYKLFQLQRTTPAQMYLRLIDDGEYGRALTVAADYGLDTDLVYQKRWETSDFGSNAIDDFLRKITKRSYINEQIQYQLPETLDACRELIKFGLKGNGLAALRELATTSPDDLGFIVFDEDEADEDDETYSGFDPIEQKNFDRKKLKKLNAKLMSQIDFSTLIASQLSLLKTRAILLKYLDRLNTFEELNGGYGSEKARRNFQPQAYECFREHGLVEYAADCARAADWRTVETLFVFHQAELAPHRLAIVACMPECVPIDEYRILLPELNPETNEIIPIKAYRPRDQDPGVGS